MSQPPAQEPYEPPSGELQVMDAVRMGWALLRGDFWPVWVLGLVVLAINVGCGILGVIPYIGGCFSLAEAIFIQPPLTAGLVYAVRRRIDGAPAQVNDVFEGFRQRYWQSVVTILPPIIVSVVWVIITAGIVLAIVAGLGIFNHPSDNEILVAVLAAVAVGLPLLIALGLVLLLFYFSLLAVWDHPESGWNAVKDSVRVVKEHFLSTLGLSLLFSVISFAVAVAGLIACCVGLFVTIPAVMVWSSATMIYLYRSWTGRPLVQPVAEGDAAPDVWPLPPEGAGPIPPTSVEPPAGPQG